MLGLQVGTILSFLFVIQVFCVSLHLLFVRQSPVIWLSDKELLVKNECLTVPDRGTQHKRIHI